MRRITGILVLNAVFFCSPVFFLTYDQTVYGSIRNERMEIEASVDQTMRDVGVCRLWTVTHDLPDSAYEKPEQIPDEKFRTDMNRRCPELRDSFIGPLDWQYFEDRKRWAKKYGKFWKKGRKND